VTVATPFDQELTDLSGKLNTTYIGYGMQRGEKLAQQSANDQQAARYSVSSAADRANSKASAQYDNAHWDLVDAIKSKDFDLKKLKEEELPDELRKLKPEDRAAYVAKKAKEREDIAQQIKGLAAKRDVYIKGEIQKKGLDTNKSFDQAVQKSITEQAAKNGFEFEKDAK